MFEGGIREGYALPESWWLMWVLLACGLAVLRTMNPDCLRQARWAWGNFRLLLQAKGDGGGLTAVDGLHNGLAGVSLALAISGMWSVAQGQAMGWALFTRLLALWFVMMAMRWCVGQLLGLTAGSTSLGREWRLNHRLLMESTAWILAPLGMVATFKGADIANAGLTLSALVWLAGWGVRQRRAAGLSELYGRNHLMAMFYICTLEILPVAVLLRAWQG